MKHFVQYHNSESMGFSASSLSMPIIFTNKSVKKLNSNIVWLISGEGKKDKDYFLAAKFKVNYTSGCTEHPKFKNSASGVGTIYGETIPLNDLPVFKIIKDDITNNFRNGLTEIKAPDVINFLESLI